jgi:uncharacterized protein YbaR (Trm112 family)
MHGVEPPAWVRPVAGAVEGLLMDARLLDILVCPICKGPLLYRKQALELICRADRLAYPVRDDIPVMLEDQARRLADSEEVE